jgi:hypothetical protein
VAPPVTTTGDEDDDMDLSTIGDLARAAGLSARGIERSAWNEISEPSAYRSSSSATTSFIASGWRISSIIAHAAVPELV